MRIRVERHSVICGTIQDSARSLWGQNLHVSLGVTKRVDEESGLAVNTKVLAKLSQTILDDLDHHTWNFPCPWGLQQHGLSLGLVTHLLNSWTDAFLSHNAQKVPTNVTLTPSNAVTLRSESKIARLSFRVPFSAVNQFNFSILGERISLDYGLSFRQKNLFQLGYPAENLTGGGHSVIVHASFNIPVDLNDMPANPISNEVICGSTTILTNKISGARSVIEAYQTLREFCSNYEHKIGGNLKVEEIEVSSDKGFSISHDANGESKIEFRLGFNATHDLSMPLYTEDLNRVTYGPCSKFPQHGHRWGLRIHLQLNLQDLQVLDYLENTRQTILALWHDLHGSHLNNLTKVISNAPATSEIVLMYVRHRLEQAGLQPDELELTETPKNTFLWKPQFDT